MKWPPFFALTLIAAVFPGGRARAETTVDYARDVKPVLAKRCYACHGALKQKGGLRLDTGKRIRKGGDSGPAVEPGKPDESLLIELVTAGEGTRMPPEGEPLAPAEIGHIRAWIAAGAPSPELERAPQDPAKHWAFVAPVRPAVPTLAGADGPRNPIDAFLADRRAQLGLKSAPAADRATLLRRVSLDLTGLSPSRDELHAYDEDRSADAYERLVDRLLASPRFGERWGRHWMDIWRYSDWAGFGAEVRESQPHIWRWRDWIVESLNADKPYDRMAREMIASDEIAPEDEGTLRATGFLVRNWFKFDRNTWLDATVEHTAKAFLGLTLNCARCHDHKFDPISQVDYYRFKAFFQTHDIVTERLPGRPDTAKDGVVRAVDARASEPTFLFQRGDEKYPDKDRPLTPAVPALFGGAVPISKVSLPAPAHYPAIRPHIRREALMEGEARRAAAFKALEKARRAEDEAGEKLVELATRLEAIQADRKAAEGALATASADVHACGKDLTAARAGLVAIRAKLDADEARFLMPADSRRVDRLAMQARHAEMQAAVLAAEAGLARAQHGVAAAPAERPKRAAAEAVVVKAKETLAAAIKAAEARPSAAYTPFEPARPVESSGRRTALANWMVGRKNPLAARVAVNHVWARHFGKPLVPVAFDFGLNGRPPTHPELLDWLAVELMESGWSLKHLHRLIVTSEAYRMQSWAPPDAPGTRLDPENLVLWRMNPRRMEAELVRDNLLQVSGDLDPTMRGPDLDQDLDVKIHRRSLYFRHANEKVSTFLRIFDSANVIACYSRDVSIVPQQALALANSPLASRQARVLAGTLTAAPGRPSATDPDRFVAAAFEQVLGRPPTDRERDACLRYLDTQAKTLATPGRLKPVADGPEAAIAPSPDPVQRAREGLVHVLLNHNDFVTIR